MPKKQRYWTGVYTKHRLKVHLVWIPKYRKRILRGKIAQHCEALLYQCAEVNHWYIEELNIQEDHVHMLLQFPPTLSIAHIVQYFKGGSSKVIRDTYPELEEFLWGESFWSDGYFAESVGIFREDVIKKYIQDQ